MSLNFEVGKLVEFIGLSLFRDLSKSGRLMNNQRGGIISSIFVIPIGMVLMIGIFFLGYYVGKYKSKDAQGNDVLPPMPEIVSENLPKKEEFTFFKTLTDRDNKTVSIDLKPRQSEETQSPKKTAEAEQQKAQAVQPKKESKPAIKPAKALTGGSETKVQAAKKEPEITRSPDTKVRYTLQVAAYQEKEMAEAEVKKMKQKGYAAFIVSSKLEGMGTWYRVRLGSFTNRASAEKLQKELHAKAGLAPFITQE